MCCSSGSQSCVLVPMCTGSCVSALMFWVACLARAVVHFCSMTCNKACVDVDMCWFAVFFTILRTVFVRGHHCLSSLLVCAVSRTRPRAVSLSNSLCPISLSLHLHPPPPFISYFPISHPSSPTFTMSMSHFLI